MHVVKLLISTTESMSQPFAIQIEGKRGDSYMVERVIDGMTGAVEADQTIELRGDQRLVLVPKEKKFRWDKEQMANVAVTDEEDKAMAKKEEERQAPKKILPPEPRPQAAAPKPAPQPQPQPAQAPQKPAAAQGGPGLHNPMKGTKD